MVEFSEACHLCRREGKAVTCGKKNQRGQRV